MCVKLMPFFCAITLIVAACSNAKETDSPLAASLKAAEEYYRPFLPRMADDETRLDSVKASATELRFESTMVNTVKSELDLKLLDSILQPELEEQAQRFERLNALLQEGATLVYSYKDKKGVHVAEFRVGPEVARKPGADLDAPLGAAKTVYELYVQYACNFDPSMAELYADGAKMSMTRNYPDGTSRTRTVPSWKLKEFIRAIMPTAKKRGDTCRFSVPEFKEEGTDKVRVKVKQYSDLGQYWSDVSLLIVKSGEKWLIQEDITVSAMPNNEKD